MRKLQQDFVPAILAASNLRKIIINRVVEKNIVIDIIPSALGEFYKILRP
jgi:hypothetical protein